MSKSKPSGAGAAGEAASPQYGSRASRELRPRVLVVDDHPLHRIRAEIIFAEFGCKVAQAETGDAALAACATEAFDLIVLDRRMPGTDGDTVVQRLRARPGPSRATFVACCSTDPPGELSAGYDIVVPKPLTSDVAAGILKAAFRGSPIWSHLAPILLTRSRDAPGEPR